MTLPSVKFNPEWLDQVVSDYKQLSDENRNNVLDVLIHASGPNQLLALSQSLPELLLRDFISYLPPEIVICILQYLDGEQLLVCCQVCKSWYHIISSLTSLWYHIAERAGAYVEFNPELDSNETKPDSKESDIGAVKYRGNFYKKLYLHTLATLRNFQTGRSIDIQEEFIDKGAFRITFVGYQENYITTGCDDHTVQMWSIKEGEILNSIATHSVCCLTVGGHCLYTASFNANAESWDLITRRHCQTFTSHTSAVLAIDVTREETFLLTGSVDKTAKLWDLQTNPAVLIKTFRDVHEDWVFQVKFLPAHPGYLQFLTCDANMCHVWYVDCADYTFTLYSVTTASKAKFTSFFYVPYDPFQMYTCQWEEVPKVSWLTKFSIQPETCITQRDMHFEIPMPAVKAYLLGAGRKFAVFMCSISRKDFHVIDIPRKYVVATIVTPDFCMLTRNGSTVTLCDTSWLDGFDFAKMTTDIPVFAASVGRNTVILGTWAERVKVSLSQGEKGDGATAVSGAESRIEENQGEKGDGATAVSGAESRTEENQGEEGDGATAITGAESRTEENQGNEEGCEGEM